MSPVRSVEVALGTRSYPIRIGAGLLRDRASLAACAPGRHVLILSDHNVAEHYLAPVQAAFADKSCRVLILPPGEREKNLERFAELMHTLAALKASRDATIVALGGGVIGDLAGFAAACWMRGIRFVQLPTTLLAMVDSSVGGKTAVDLPEGKNLVGAFHQPASVLIDTDALHTLPERELRAGLAEVIKYGAIFDAAFFDWLEQHVDALLARSPEHLAHAIEQSCRHKAAVVARDETEQGDRALLNFGHTFGHAIETLGGYALLLHGEAVAIGMLCAARLSQRLGLAPAADCARLERLLQAFGLPTVTPAQLDRAALLDAMRLDKKNRSGTLRLILWRGIGQAFIQDAVDESATEAAFDNATND